MKRFSPSSALLECSREPHRLNPVPGVSCSSPRVRLCRAPAALAQWLRVLCQIRLLSHRCLDECTHTSKLTLERQPHCTRLTREHATASANHFPLADTVRCVAVGSWRLVRPPVPSLDPHPRGARHVPRPSFRIIDDFAGAAKINRGCVGSRRARSCSARWIGVSPETSTVWCELPSR